MFSGIVEDIGTVLAVSPRGGGRTLTVKSRIGVGAAGQAGVGASARERVGLGDSVAVNGACLTVEAVHPPDRFVVVCGRETLEVTTLGGLAPGARVHLERALRPTDRLDGHIVAGHIDGVGQLVELRRLAESVVLWLEVPAELSRYVATKGSVAVDGVSLTVNEVEDRPGGAARFRVNLIPYTADQTLLGGLAAGARVNVEVDVLARYLERLMGPRAAGGGLTPERLAELGYRGRPRS